MFRTGLIVSAVILSTITTAVAQKETITEGAFYGCTTKELGDRIGDIGKQGDMDAALRFLKVSLIRKECIVWKEGQTVFTENYSYGMRCLRPAGEIDRCYLTIKESIGK